MKIDFLGHHLDCLPELAQLHFNEWQHVSPDTTLEDRILRLQEMARSSDMPFIVVAIENDQLVGSAALVKEDMTTRQDLSPWLANVFVKPEFRQNGIGASLVGHIEGEAARRGIRTLFLYTKRARDLYLKLGWRKVEAREYQGVSVTIMSKKIAV